MGEQKKNCKKNTNTWKLSNMLLNGQWITEEIKEEIRNTQKQMTVRTLWLKTYGMWQKLF